MIYMYTYIHDTYMSVLRLEILEDTKIVHVRSITVSISQFYVVFNNA